MNPSKELLELQNKLLSVCAEANLLIKFEVGEYELEPAQDEAFFDLKENNPDCAVCVGIKDDYMQRIFLLDRLGANEFAFVEISQGYQFFNIASLGEDGIWDLNVVETREGDNW